MPLGTSFDTFLNLGFIIYPWAAVLVYGVEVTASVCCLFFRQLRPVGAGGLTMLMLSLCVWQVLIYSLMIISSGNNQVAFFCLECNISCYAFFASQSQD